LENKILAARRSEKRIEEQLDEIAENEHDVRDRLMLQHFVLEQMSPFKRYALRKEFFLFHKCSPGLLDGRLWVLSWFAIVCLYGFYLYWILQWGISNGNTTFEYWGIGFALAACQDILLNEPIILFFIHMIATELMRPQLKHIYNVLNSVALEISSANRNFNEDINFVQYFSSACRAARSPKAFILPSADLLRHLTDFDLSLCRENRHASLGVVGAILIVIPAMLSFGSDHLQEGAYTILSSGASASFIVLNDFVASTNANILIAVYITIVVVIFVYYKVYKPRRKKRVRSARTDGTSDVNSKGTRFLSLSKNPSRTIRRLSRIRLLTSQSTQKYFNYNSPIKTEWRNMNLPSLLHGEVVRISTHNVSSHDPMEWNRNIESVQSSMKENPSTKRSSLVNVILPAAPPDRNRCSLLCHRLSSACFCVPDRYPQYNLSIAQTQSKSRRLSFTLFNQVITTKLQKSRKNAVSQWKIENTQKQRDKMRMRF
jgi:hypothetical protein